MQIYTISKPAHIIAQPSGGVYIGYVLEAFSNLYKITWHEILYVYCSFMQCWSCGIDPVAFSFALMVCCSPVCPEELEERRVAGCRGIRPGVPVLRCGQRHRAGCQASHARRSQCRDLQGDLAKPPFFYYTNSMIPSRLI
jgi:hypothetical protein